jgi:glycerophosphoryl diester phosphodiesterase
VTGFLAEDEAGFADALRRLDELDPVACMAAAGEPFTPVVMATAYARLYAAASSRRRCRSAGSTGRGGLGERGQLMAVRGSEPSGVEVVAHRGASADEPEHTLGAYRHAVRLGADAVECDVRMTRDGALVCVHDRHIDRTSTGRGVISALDLADLERFKFGRTAAMAGRRRTEPVAGMEDDERPDENAGRVLTLDRLLEYVTSTPGQVRLAIETKHPTRHSTGWKRRWWPRCGTSACWKAIDLSSGPADRPCAS